MILNLPQDPQIDDQVKDVDMADVEEHMLLPRAIGREAYMPKIEHDTETREHQLIE